MDVTAARLTSQAERHQMPIGFEPPPIGTKAVYGDNFGLKIPYLTTKDAVAAFLPPALEPPDEPLVYVGYKMVRDVQRLAGRGYNIVSVDIGAMLQTDDGPVESTLALILWETDCDSIIAGREYFGVPKLYGDIPDADLGSSTWEFSCSEYGTRLVTGIVKGMERVEGNVGAEVSSSYLAWKYVPRLGGGADVNYLATVDSRSWPTQFWQATDEAVVDFARPEYQLAPVSSRIMQGLGRLPVIEYRPATALKGPSEIDRAISRTFPSGA